MALNISIGYLIINGISSIKSELYSTIKEHSKMCSFVTTKCHRCLKLKKREIGMLTARMSTREFNVHFSTVGGQCRLENLAACSTGLPTADQVYGVLWVRSLLMSTL
jgi:hypothetical protein